MAHTYLLAFCLLLPMVVTAIHISAKPNDIPCSFVSKNKLFCAQASQVIVTHALNHFKSMPRGKLYDDAVLNPHKSCSELGYNHSAGEDPCYPGLHTFYHSKQEGGQFMKELQNNLREYGKRKELNLDEANFVDTCKCHDKSYAKTNVGNWFDNSCDIEPLLFSVGLQSFSFVSKDKLYCAQGTKEIATDALNLFKSMPRGKLYDGAVLNLHKSCSYLGYKKSSGEDPCYPGLHTFYHSKQEGGQFMRELQNHLREYGGSNHLALDDANLADTCKCHEKSYAKKNVGKMFNRSCGKLDSLSSDAPCSFVSKNKLFCAQAPESVAIDALKVFRSMPRGKMYDGTTLNLQLSCSDMGYTRSSGIDPCYPGLHTFYHDNEGKDHFNKELQNHLKEFGMSAHLTLEEAKVVDTCKCHETSYARTNVWKNFNKTCDNSHSLFSEAPSSFVSNNKLFCAQAPASMAIDALNQFKSMPRGKLYGTLYMHKTCSTLGYNQSAGQDPCYPGLHAFYRNKEEEDHFMTDLNDHLKEFGANRDLTLDEARFQDSCKCHEKSTAKGNAGKHLNKSCGVSDAPRSFVSKNKLFCAQGPESMATNALNLFKSMPRGKMYNGTILNLQLSCADMGYKQSVGEDKCFPGLHLFSRNKEDSDSFYKDLQNQLKIFGESTNLTLKEATFKDACMCQQESYAKSNVMKMFKKSCGN